MKKLLTLLAALAVTLALAVTAWADYDYIDRYDITVTPGRRWRSCPTGRS